MFTNPTILDLEISARRHELARLAPSVHAALWARSSGTLRQLARVQHSCRQLHAARDAAGQGRAA